VAGGRSALSCATVRVGSEAGSVAPVDPRDWTAHSECALRQSAGVNVRRLVFSVSEPSMRILRAPYERAAGIAMRCDEIFPRCDRKVEVVGPLLEEEGLPVHRRFWPNANPDV
jgi:hypothetical protein